MFNKLNKTLVTTSAVALSLLSLPAHAQLFEIESATATGTHPFLSPDNAIDGNLSFSSRWAGRASPEDLTIDLGTNQTIDDVQILWGYSQNRQFTFEIQARPGTSGAWSTVFEGTSASQTDDFENYDVTDMSARQIRILGLSNSDGSPWTTIREVAVSGPDGSDPQGETGGPSPLPADAEYLDIQSATGVGTHPALSAANAIDGVTGQRSRWAGDAAPEELILDLGSNQTVENIQILWNLGTSRSYTFDVAGRSGTSGAWTTIFTGASSGASNDFENYDLDDIVAQQIRIRGLSNSAGSRWTSIEEVTLTGIEGVSNPFGLSASAEPWENFDLTDWAHDSPEPRPSDACRSVRTDEDEWGPAFRSSLSGQSFFTLTDGGMRFVSRVGGATTNSSCNAGFPRSELREMLRQGNTSISTQGANGNNWALGYQPSGGNYGGRNGELKATLRINKVTTTGDGEHPGRTIIGQIHADNDEPMRLYYRKPPEADYGCVYAVHEIRDGDDIHFNLMGDRNCQGNGPANGIQLDELFSYEITNVDENIDVVIRRGDHDGPIIAQTTVDMDALNSGYDRADEWMYFKAGLYTQNNTGDPDDTDVATFYRLSNTHDVN